MRIFIDSNVLLGWILPDDMYHDSTKVFLGTLPHGGNIQIVNQVLSDLNRMVNEESRWLLKQLNELLPLAKIEETFSAGEYRQAKQIITAAMRKIQLTSGGYHTPIKKYVESEMMNALDSGNLRKFVTDLSIDLPRFIEDRVAGALGPEAIGTPNGLPTSKDAKNARSIDQELAGEKEIFKGERAEGDRRILSGLILECHRAGPISFYTFDRAFYDGYMEFWKRTRSLLCEPARNLDFVLLDNDNIEWAMRFRPAIHGQQREEIRS